MSAKNKDAILLRQHKNQLMQQYENIAVQMIKWEGLPDEIPKYAPERWLYTQGQATFFKIPSTDLYAILPVAAGSVKLDIYGVPQEWRAFAVGASPQAELINNTTLNTDNAVIIWANQRHQADTNYVETIVDKMAQLDRTLDINCMLQRKPYVIKTDKNNLLTVQNVLKEITDGKQFLLDGGLELNACTEVFDINVPFIGADLSDQYETYHDRILRYFGIDYLPVEKQERMVTDEANANNQELEVRRQTRIVPRQVACDRIKELFNIDVSVEYEQPEYLGMSDTSAMSGTQEDSAASGGPKGASGQEH